MDEIFDIDCLRVGTTEIERFAHQPKKKLPRHKPDGRFLKGPIPWDWIDIAIRLPGSAFHLSMLLWHLAGFAKQRTFKASMVRLLSIGISEKTARRALKSLEYAGLISIDHQPGQSLVITLNDVSEPKADS